MASSSSNQPCSTCQGGGLVQNAGGQVQTCPICGGSGKQYIPGLFYNYAIQIILAANASSQQFINILNGAFKWIFATMVNTGPFTIQLADTKNNRQFSNVPLHAALLFGTAQNPFPVLNPWTFQNNGSIQINVTDLSGAQNTIWLNFIGVQLIPSADQASSTTPSTASS